MRGKHLLSTREERASWCSFCRSRGDEHLWMRRNSVLCPCRCHPISPESQRALEALGDALTADGYTHPLPTSNDEDDT